MILNCSITAVKNTVNQIRDQKIQAQIQNDRIEAKLDFILSCNNLSVLEANNASTIFSVDWK